MYEILYVRNKLDSSFYVRNCDVFDIVGFINQVVVILV